ncbi:DNA-directed RNA polymerase II subunit RPB1-like isoform X7 [Colias croceus]|uniref:DNA-directed RNA polymerase II subunit RPB1-like isoform X7 n=1 Tax=Colias crocea TaxID=72248 RepID=UPI001E27F21D|nr:DNA-directed RNA polymerase II subunit RPB1-like isoform X7 [Colias croceus]
MATGPKIVHKQFNSPIGLYSQQNIQETLNKHLQNLDNGTVGIDFHNPTTEKPANLANSAVLRMLEEEERNRKGYPNQKKVVWPPTPETNGYHQSQQQQSPAFYNNAQHSPSQPQYSPQSSVQPAQPSYQAPYQTQPQSQSYLNQAPQPQSGFCEGRRQETTGLSKLIPVGPGVTAAPLSPTYRQVPTGPLSPSAQPYRQQQSRWAPVPAPISPQPSNQKPQFSPQSQYSPQPQYSEPAYQPPQRHFEPPPTTITLRPQQPVHQSPSPVFASQPAAASFQGGINMRGDTKWPPQSVKEAVAAENEARRQLAKGPACRPRKVQKDYSNFFSQHALNHSYTSYRVPPGTQHYDDHSGRSSY